MTPLARLVDYSFEPFSGRIVLATFLPSVDEDLNPVSLRVTYEVDQGGEKFWVCGGDAQVKLGERVEVGGSAVGRHQRAGAATGWCSANATWRLGRRRRSWPRSRAARARSTPTRPTSP